ncbi:hypothetical protein NUM_43380 [Actinocatenispora comari]|uniref:Uncharacterized protein n=1 Tax=Actinocatenispora comari TaxID=2807577 RepID=A0A8J4ACY7_9ACTN|nr:hypothetical protein NUM_43380 [Actinocatenispora comari]
MTTVATPPARTTNRPCPRGEAPDEVHDRLLWNLAADVLAAHQPDARGHCTNLQCTTNGHYPCPPAATAMCAQTLAAHTPQRATSPPSAVTSRPGPARPLSIRPARRAGRTIAVGRRRTPTPSTWVGWFGSLDAPALTASPRTIRAAGSRRPMALPSTLRTPDLAAGRRSLVIPSAGVDTASAVGPARDPTTPRPCTRSGAPHRIGRTAALTPPARPVAA